MAKATNLISDAGQKKEEPKSNPTPKSEKMAITKDSDISPDTPLSPNENQDAIETVEVGGMTVPAIFQGLPGLNELPEVSGLPFAPYVACCSGMSKQYKQQRDAGCEDGEFYLAADGQIYRMHPMPYILLSASQQYYTMADRTGNIIDALYNKPENDDRFQNHIISVVLVFQGSTLIPAKAEFRGTRMGAISPAIKECKASLLPEWVNQSEAHKVACGYGIPLARVVNYAKSTAKPSQSSGQTMYIGSCVSRPATVEQLTIFHKSLQSQDFQEKVEFCKTAFRDRETEFKNWADKHAS